MSLPGCWESLCVHAAISASRQPASAPSLSYAAAKFSRCFQLRVPGKAAQQPEGPGSGTAAGGGPRGANSVLSLPSEPCPLGSGRQGEAAILCPAPHRLRTHEGPSGPTCLHLPTLLARLQTPCAVDVGETGLRKSPKSFPQSKRVCSSPPQASKGPTTTTTGALAKGELSAQRQVTDRSSGLGEVVNARPFPWRKVLPKNLFKTVGCTPERCPWEQAHRRLPAPALLSLPQHGGGERGQGERGQEGYFTIAR